MSKAEERALEFYPMKDYNKEPNYIYSCDSKTLDEIYRQVFMLGYEASEKDLTLTAEDIRTIYELSEKVSNHSVWAKYSSGFWDEVLKRFKETKK